GTYSVAVAYTDAIGYRETLYSPDRFVSAFNNGNGIAGQITSSIVGVFREGLTLGAAGVSADPDGVASNPNYAYQWFKNGSPIAGATRNTYSVPFNGSGTYRVAVSYTDLQGFRATVNSPNQLVGKNLVGTSRPDTLNGTAGTDLITGLEGADRLFGGGASDTFRYNKFSDSRLSAFDRITDLAISVDVIDGPTAVRASVLSELGQASALSQQGLGRLLNQFVFPVNGAATFTIGSGASRRTFLALDDGSLGFDAKKDALIEITGYTGKLANLSIS
ncbi:MAG: bluetail domain-containing putative surface protein, partial [Cyanobacteriota bacterium]|nr:bluetail domain-containing putative surface protein [Cyanobacteriota bacterium]